MPYRAVATATAVAAVDVVVVDAVVVVYIVVPTSMSPEVIGRESRQERLFMLEGH